MQQVSARVKAAVREQAAVAGRPVYLDSANTDEEQFARAIATCDGIRQGLVCLLTGVEPSRTFEVYRYHQR